MRPFGRPLRLFPQWTFEHKKVAMSAKKRAPDKNATTIGANDPDAQKGALKLIGGSQFDDWNSILANQTLTTLWLAHSKKETRDRQYSATFAALVGIGPKD